MTRLPPGEDTLRSAGTARLSSIAALVALGLATVLAAGCARVGPPTGGPADTTPPEVAATIPLDGATEVPSGTDIRIEFSEEMDRVATERALSIAPRIDLENFRWDGRALVARPAEDLPDSTTFIVQLEETARDYHDVTLEAPFVLTFATGATLDTGAIEGIVTMSGEALAGATVWACSGGVRTEGEVARRCRYSAVTDADGGFRIAGVADSPRPYTLLAFIDSDGDGEYSVTDETGVIADVEAIIDEPGAEASGIRIELEKSPEVIDAPLIGEEE